MKYLKGKWVYLILILFSLTPLVWFYGKGNVLISGVDTNFPLNPLMWFLRRFYTWNPIANAGLDFSSSTAGLFFHLIQVIPYSIGFSLQMVEIISLVFWFGVLVFSSYFFARTIISKRFIIQLLFVSLYCFNLYLFNTWENIKVGNLSLYGALPLGLAILYKLQKRELNLKGAFLYIVLTGIILSGSGINPAYFACFVLAVIIFLISNTILDFKFKKVLLLLKNAVIFLVVIVLTNFFWILPTSHFISTYLSPNQSIDKLGFTNWVDSLSENTSFLNVFRAQGAWDWYPVDGITQEPLYIPYSSLYFKNTLFVSFSFLLPLLAILSLIFLKKDKRSIYLMLSIFLLLSVFLGAGTHLPSGSIFRFFSSHVPFFSLFRSPWYIFTPFLIFSIAGLISLLFDYLFSLKESNKKSLYLRIFSKNEAFYSYMLYGACIALILANLFYNYPLIKGTIYRPLRYDSFFVKFPSYIFESGKWLEENNKGRVISYPDDELENYKWGYRGIESLLNLIVDAETLYRPLNDVQAPAVKLVDVFYKYLGRGQISAANAIAKKLAISKILEKKDQNSLALDLKDKLSSYKVNEFGLWKFYSLPDDVTFDKIYTSSEYAYAYPVDERYKGIALLDGGEVLLNPQDSIVKQNVSLSNPGKTVILSSNSQTTDYINFIKGPSKLSSRLLERFVSLVLFEFSIPEKNFYQPVLERYRLEDFGISTSDPLQVEIDGENKVLTISSINDSLVFFNGIEFEKGNHSILMPLKNDNLIKNFINLDPNAKEGEGLITAPTEDNEQVLSIFNNTGKDTFLVYKINDFDPLRNYLIKLKYRQVYGNDAVVFVTQKVSSGLVKVQVERMPHHPDWNNFSFFFEPVKTKSDLEIRLAAPETPDPLGTTVFYSSLSVQKIFDNNLFLISESSPSSTNRTVTFQKKSPIEYKGEVKNVAGKHTLVFSENFSENWGLEIFDKNGDKISKDLLHFSVNYFANGWFIDMPNDYNFRIFYKPQILFWLGLGVSAIVLSISVFFFLISRKNEQKI